MNNVTVLHLLIKAQEKSGQSCIAKHEVISPVPNEVKQPVVDTTPDVNEEFRQQMAFPTFGA